MGKHLVFLTLFSAFTAQACPTCIGRIKEKSPAFFSEESYKPGQNDAQKQNNEQDDTGSDEGDEQ